MMKRLFCFLFLLLPFCVQKSLAQELLPFTPRSPKALIVLLPYGSQRIHMLKELGDTATAQALASDYKEMRQHMVADFKDNYSYGTLYFLPDSIAYTLGERGSWNGIFLDKNLNLVQTPVVNPSDSPVLVAQYGLRARTTEKKETIHGTEESYGDDYVGAIYPTIILTDINLKPFPRKMRRLRGVKLTPEPLRYPRWVYYYRSSRFQIGYNHTASMLSARLVQTFGPSPASPEQ